MTEVAAYKQILADVIARRPSGTRQRLATALSKNRSFVSQICNPAYATPIPAAHLEIIFEVCHFPAAEKKQFLAAYGAAHPGRRDQAAPTRPHGTRPVALPDLGHPEQNARLHALVSDFVRGLAQLMEDTPHKGRRS